MGPPTLWMHRRSPLFEGYGIIREHGPVAVVGGELTDHPAVLELIERFEGQESAAIAERWLAAQPENLLVVRSPTGLASFFPGRLPDRPVVVRRRPRRADHSRPHSRDVTRATGRAGVDRSVFRWFGGLPAGSLCHVGGLVAGTIEWVTRPLAWTFVPTVDPEFCGPGFSYVGFTEQFVTELDGAATRCTGSIGDVSRSTLGSTCSVNAGSPGQLGHRLRTCCDRRR